MRIRTIKPSFFLHDVLFDLEKSSKLPVRLAFIGLWCAADREGRFEWRPRMLKPCILPHDSCDFGAVMDALASEGFILRYGDRGQWGFIPSFHAHQHVNLRESASVLPEPPDTCVHVRARGEGKGREGKGKGKEEFASLNSHTSEGGMGEGAGAPVEQRGENGQPKSETAKRFTRPTDAELTLMAEKIGLPESERLKFAAYYDSNGWRVGRNPMKSVAGAMAGWKVRWQERGGVNGNGQPAQSWHDEEAQGIIRFANGLKKDK